MKKRFPRNLVCLFLAFTVLLGAILQGGEVSALSKYGSRGEEVRQIQTKLKRWGYYNGSVDGIYGKETGKRRHLFSKEERPFG